MTITRKQLYLSLISREPWHPRAADWRKLPNGRIFRFVRWNWKDRATAEVPPNPHADCGHPRKNAASIFINKKETNND